MKQKKTFTAGMMTVLVLSVLFISGCSAPDTTARETLADPVAANIKAYTHTWDEIINKGRLEMFNDTNFTTDVTMYAKPENVVGIEGMKNYYANYLTGFSNIEFSIVDVFGQDDKLVKHWRFKGTHSGDFFGIPATGKAVDVEGTTLVRMSGGKIAAERDFFDNLEFMTQLGLIPPAE